MIGANTTYGPGSSSTAVSGGPAAGNPNDEMLRRLISQRLGRALTPAPTAQQPRARGNVGRRSMPAGGGGQHRDGPTQRDSMMQGEEDRARIAQLRAISGPAPVRMTTFGGSINGWTPDVTAMSGAQRKVFLPEDSRAAPGGADTILDQQRAAADKDWTAGLQGDRAAASEYGTADPAAVKEIARRRAIREMAQAQQYGSGTNPGAARSNSGRIRLGGENIGQ